MGGGQQIRTVGVFLGHVITGEVQRRGASVYRSLVAPRGSSIVFKVETGQLRGCAGAHGARGCLGIGRKVSGGKSGRLRLVGGLLEDGMEDEEWWWRSWFLQLPACLGTAALHRNPGRYDGD